MDCLTEVQFNDGMNMNKASLITLIAATISVGFMAAIFTFYSNTIMPGLKRADDRTFVGAFQEIDRAIINPLFIGGGVVGAAVLTGLAALLHLNPDLRSALPWILGALLLYLVALMITGAVNVPLNDDIKAAGDLDRIADLSAVREQFNEARWVRWNHVRAVTTMVAFGCLSWALVLHGRLTAL